MNVRPSYKITPEILELVASVNAHLIAFTKRPVPAIVNDKIRQVSLLKSSLFSARIEGNTLRPDAFEHEEEGVQKREVFNIMDGAEYIEKSINRDIRITADTIKSIHRRVMNGLSPDAGKFRTEPSAIFNQAGVAVYVPPSPQHINEYIQGLLASIYDEVERFPLISALVGHLVFEKIHPFVDGNGRVGRLLIPAILKSKGYNLPVFIPFEEYLDANRDEYYYVLDVGLKDCNAYLKFMLSAFSAQIERLEATIEHELAKKEILPFTPRQEELYFLIRDHRMLSFDSVRRRFAKVPERTLRYDLKKLQDMKKIVKIGKTRGSWYKINEV